MHYAEEYLVILEYDQLFKDSYFTVYQKHESDEGTWHYWYLENQNEKNNLDATLAWFGNRLAYLGVHAILIVGIDFKNAEVTSR